MKEIISKKACTGCTACMNICPKHAITMKENKEGFAYPIIDSKKCINCGLCKKNCPVLNLSSNNSINKCYVGFNKYDKERLKSSSGAIFPLIANYILNNHGIVIGAAFDNKQLKHIAIKKNDELDKLRGSKYLQSNLDDIFTFIKNSVNESKILFVGTPCQVAGLKAFLKKDFENLICIDLFCHGVPSPKLFTKYIMELENKYDDNLVDYDFRDKISGWDSYSTTAKFKNKSITELSSKNNYMRLFLSDVALRDSCYNCSFKLGNKYSDITLGDFWGVKKYYPMMYNKEGVSAIIVNTSKGDDIFNSIRKDIIFEECKLEEIVSGNPCLIRSSIKHKKRNMFFDDIDNMTFNKLARKYVPRKKIIILISKMKGIIKKIFKCKK